MKNIFKILGTDGYPDEGKDYGDCFLIIKDDQAVVYDCGSEEHAKEVIRILDEYGIEKAMCILSHNDDDHFWGIDYLVEADKVVSVHTMLLLKYKHEIYKAINDKRLIDSTIVDRILAAYDNIASLRGKGVLKDIYADVSELPDFISFIGPSKDYMIEAVAKDIDNRKGNTLDSETIHNALSIIISVDFGNEKILLTGDVSPKSIINFADLSEYSYIQLPHHGKPESAEDIWDAVEDVVPNPNGIIYLISDNKGNSSGGSEGLNCKGRQVWNTRTKGTIDIHYESTDAPTKSTTYSGKTLGI